MKILLAVSCTNERFNVIPDIGLGYLASIARRDGHDVHFIDCLIEGMSYDDWQEHVRKLAPDLVGIKAYSADLEPIQEMLERVRKVSPNIITMIGGPHPSTELPEQLWTQFPDLDYAIAGEAEPGWAALLKQLESTGSDFSEVPGLVWRDSSGAVQSNEKTLVDNLDDLPYPAWDMLKPERYPWGFSFMTSKYPAAPMNFTRGCPYLCTYCGSYLITGRKVRRRSAENIIEEIRMLKTDHGIQSIDVVDENFVQVKPYVMDLCEKLAQADLGVGWNNPYGVRVDRIDEEMAIAMEKAGCFGFSCGIESGSNRILKQIKKATTVEIMRDRINMIKRVTDIKIQGFFMMGFPDETVEEIESTIEFARSLPIDIAVFSPLRITPGTEIYEDMVDQGKIHAVVDFAGMGQHYFVRSYCNVSDEEMARLYKKAYRKFYGRPISLYRLARMTKSRSQLRTLTNGCKRLFMRPITRFDFRRKTHDQTTAQPAATT